MKASAIILSVALLFISNGTSMAGVEPSCDSSAEASRALVLAFYNKALISKQPRAAFERFVAPSFVEHKPDVPEGTREGVITFLQGLITQLPEARWEVLRTIAEPDLVFLHARFFPVPGSPPYMIADVFRVDKCKIIEHWDVVAPPRDQDSRPGEPVGDT